ncbi:MAG: hypothetical protein E7531_01790 [Ruminococcaceae bacterium]|nr:hypothetical protein [Oscillospiraceae bacterium]
MAKRKDLKKIMESLLKQKASEKEREFLTELGFTIKNPTRQTVVMAALYKKAAAGDLSAIKELRAITGDSSLDICRGVVTIIDDIKN